MLGKQCIRDPLGRETRFTYDEQGRQLSRTLPLGYGPDGVLGTDDDDTLPEGDFTEWFEYDDRGRQTLHVSFEGVVTMFVYSEQTGRLIEKHFFDNLDAYANGAGTPGETWTYTYDAFGREVKVTQVDFVDSTERVTASVYNAQGRLTQVSSPEGVVTYAYDALGHKTRTSVFSAAAHPTVDFPESTTRYTYDALGRLQTVVEDLDPLSTLDVPLSTSYAYDLVGNLDRTDLPNGVITDYEYDDLNRLDVMTHYAPDGSVEAGIPDPDLSNNQPLAEFDYEVRADGTRDSVTETFWFDSDADGTPEAHVNQIDWTYDNVGRLIDEVFDHYDDLLDQSQHFTYDLASNRLERTVDEGNNAVIDEIFSSTYDANDRLLQEVSHQVVDGSPDPATAQTTTYGYDHTQQTSKEVFSSSLQSPASRIPTTCKAAWKRSSPRPTPTAL